MGRPENVTSPLKKKTHTGDAGGQFLTEIPVHAIVQITSPLLRTDG